jgi:methylated-DNA-[protein]-cysteine S-methyltransferase
MATAFQQQVWDYLKTIPRGQVRTYSQVAAAIGKPKAARAVANACGKNPNLVTTPCHRVVRADGSLGGYSGAGGISRKRELLKAEGAL